MFFPTTGRRRVEYIHSNFVQSFFFRQQQQKYLLADDRYIDNSTSEIVEKKRIVSWLR